MRYKILAWTIAIVLPAVAWSQGIYRRRPTINAAPPVSGVPTPTFEGTLKSLSKKEIVIQLQSDQTLTIRRGRKTKFLENEKDVKPENIALGTPLAVDVKEDLDAKPLAVRVVVNPPPPKETEKTP